MRSSIVLARIVIILATCFGAATSLSACSNRVKLGIRESSVKLSSYREKNGFESRSSISTGKKAEDVTSRRQVFSQFSNSATVWTGAALFSSLVLSPIEALAAAPLTADEADNLGARAERSLRKKPPKILRPNLNMDFAVLLMRSSYNAMDAIDCVAMDQFQKDFFLIRQAEYLPYVNALGPGVVKQGELKDPYYFDFISFAQYATISREITVDPPMVFEEQQPVIVAEDEPQQFVTKVIKRDPTLADKALLPIKHGELVGASILDRLNEIFGDTTSAIPPILEGSRPDTSSLLISLKQLVNLFLLNGFAWDGKVELIKEGKKNNSASGAEFVITFTSPATIWSGQALKLRKATPTNDFIMKTASTLLSRAGYDVSLSLSSVKYTTTQEVTTIVIK